MEIKIVTNSLEVEPQSVTPAIKFKIEYDFQENTVPLTFEGKVYTSDLKFISNVTVLPPSEFYAISPLGRDGGGENMFVKPLGSDTISRSLKQYKEFMFTIDFKSLEYIETLREKTNDDVTLIFYINITYLNHSLAIGNYKKIEQGNESYLVLANTQNAIRADNSFNILVGTQNEGSHGHTVLKSGHGIQKISYTIKASEWINNFKEGLKIGKFILIEIAQLNLDFQSINRFPLEKKEQIFKDRLIAATEIVQQMESELKNGEYGRVVEKLRGLEVIREDVKQYIKQIITVTTGMNEENVQDFTIAIDKLLHYGSALHHPMDSKGNLQSAYRGGKEDAYMVYMTTTSVVNLLGKKFISVMNQKYNAPAE